MHFFVQSRNKKSNQSSRQKIIIQDQQVQRKVLKKIIVKKKPKEKLINLADQIMQVSSHSHFTENQHQNFQSQQSFKLSGNQQTPSNPFASFMAKNQSQDELQTPMIKFGQSHNIMDSYGRKVSPEKVIDPSIQDFDNDQKYLIRSQSKPVQSIKYDNLVANDKKVQKKLSVQVEAGTFQKKQQKFPTQNSSDQDSFNFQNLQTPRNINLGSKMHSFGEIQNLNMQKANPYNYQKLRPPAKLGVTPKLHSFSEFQNDHRRVQSKDSIPKHLQILKSAHARHNTYEINQNEQINFDQSNSQQEGQNFKPTKLQTSAIQQLGHAFRSQRSLLQASQGHQITTQSSQPSLITLNVQQQNARRNPSGKYQGYIQKQRQELEEQRFRMMQYSQQANQVICNEDVFQFGGQNSLLHNMNTDNKFNQLKYMIDELIELFCIGQVIKYQLKYRSFEILTKIYSEGSKYYQEKIQLQQPIKAHTFSLALKAIFKGYQKKQLDLIITKIFHSYPDLNYEEFFRQFQSILNPKQVALFQPDSMKKQVDKTLDKIKKLFVIWIQIDYYTKKIKDVLRNNKVVSDAILIQCSTQQQPQKFDIELIQKFLLQASRKNQVKRLKVGIFFRHLIGTELIKKNWTDWIFSDQSKMFDQVELKKNVVSKIGYERKSYVSKLKAQENIPPIFTRPPTNRVSFGNNTSSRRRNYENEDCIQD